VQPKRCQPRREGCTGPTTWCSGRLFDIRAESGLSWSELIFGALCGAHS